jgi:Flp pilus assembly pilin Flp
MQFMLRSKKRLSQAGQGMTEYIIIVALIAVSAIGVYSLFGQTIRDQTAGLAQEMAGTSGSSAQASAAAAAADAQTKADAKKGLSNYHADQNR